MTRLRLCLRRLLPMTASNELNGLSCPAFGASIQLRFWYLYHRASTTLGCRRGTVALNSFVVMHGHLCAPWTARPFHVVDANTVRFPASVCSLCCTAALLGAHATAGCTVASPFFSELWKGCYHVVFVTSLPQDLRTNANLKKENKNVIHGCPRQLGIMYRTETNGCFTTYSCTQVREIAAASDRLQPFADTFCK
jgi:hypothetical protein